MGHHSNKKLWISSWILPISTQYLRTGTHFISQILPYLRRRYYHIYDTLQLDHDVIFGQISHISYNIYDDIYNWPISTTISTVLAISTAISTMKHNIYDNIYGANQSQLAVDITISTVDFTISTQYPRQYLHHIVDMVISTI